jgi:alanine-synthesizing transaminase
MYLFPKLDPKMYKIENDQQLILKILVDTKVLLVQGSGFNWRDNNHFRIVFLPNEDDLGIAIKRLGEFFMGMVKQ